MKRLLLFALTLLFSLLLIQKQAIAAEYFSTSYKVTYTVSDDGNTHAKMQVTLKNKTKDYFASSYKMKVGFEHIENLLIRDPEGALDPKITQVDGGTSIEAVFNKRIVGKDNTLSYTINFDTPDVAKKDGSIWEINIPGLADDGEEFEDFITEVIVPESFGEPSYIKPKSQNNETTFTKEQLGKSGISIAYGRTQVYGFSLFYHLKNSNLFPIQTKIALPPSTNYQNVSIEYMSPKPLNVTQDEDGNWLATYKLSPAERTTVQVRGTAQVNLSPQKVQLTEKQLENYLAEKPFWETGSEEVKKLAAELKTPRAIYEYLVKNLEYDFARVEENKTRLGARGTLMQKDSAVCLEFTDLFIALARAAGIPAREVDGFANTENARQRPLSLVKDILHAWPEYYDSEKQTWVMVDPTWGNTTGGVDYFDVLDFDHVAFVIRGKDSEYPIPAGGYKYKEDENQKDVNVSFPRFLAATDPSISVSISEESKNLSLLPLQADFTISNTGSTFIPPQKMQIATAELYPSLQSYEIPGIPPFGHTNVTVHYKALPLLTNSSFPLTITIAGITLDQSIRVTPLLYSSYLVIGGSFIAVLTLIIFVIAKKTRRLSVQR